MIFLWQNKISHQLSGFVCTFSKDIFWIVWTSDSTRGKKVQSHTDCNSERSSGQRLESWLSMRICTAWNLMNRFQFWKLMPSSKKTCWLLTKLSDWSPLVQGFRLERCHLRTRSLLCNVSCQLLWLDEAEGEHLGATLTYRQLWSMVLLLLLCLSKW